MYKNCFYRSSPVDTSNIRILNGEGYINYEEKINNDEMGFSTDYQKESSEEENDKMYNSKISPRSPLYEKLWFKERNGKRHIVSVGDLKYDIGDDVVAVLPYYYDGSEPSELVSISGKIINIISKDTLNLDIPREVRGPKNRSEKSNENINLNGKKMLTVKNWREPSNNTIQTMVVKYKIKLDKPYILTNKQVSKFKIYINGNSKLPYFYDLKFESSDSISYDIIDVSYRYILGHKISCYKSIANLKKLDIDEIDMFHINSYVKNFDLYCGAFVCHYDENSNQSSEENYNFLVIDHICMSPLDIRFIIMSDSSMNKIVSISSLNVFNIRNSYPIKDYKIFNPMSKSFYVIMNSEINQYNAKSAKSIVQDIFSQIKVYNVKKSLCNVSDIESKIYEDPYGNITVMQCKDSHIPKTFNSKYSGISLISYVKGLAYPEGNPPSEHNSYIFFHSKDYHEFIFDHENKYFMEFQPVVDKNKLYRNPTPGDVILAVPFICNRDQFKGKVNLKWFYPSDEFRLLHLYITTEGNHAHFLNLKHSTRSKPQGNINTGRIRSSFTGINLCLFDLYEYGVCKDNPTLNSEFTVGFISKYFWWEKLKRDVYNNRNSHIHTSSNEK